MNLDYLSLDPNLDQHAKAAFAKCSDDDVKAVLAILVDLQAVDPGTTVDLGDVVDQVRRLHPRRRLKLAARVDDRGIVHPGAAPVASFPVDDDADGASFGRLLEQDAERADAVERKRRLPERIDARAFQISAENGLDWQEARQQAIEELLP